MGDLKELADQAAEELLKAIRDQARTASDLKLLQLAQAYSMVVSTEVSTRLADEGATAMAESMAEYESGVVASISPELVNLTGVPQGGIVKGSLLVGGPIPVLAARVDRIPFHRQDNFMASETTAANPNYSRPSSQPPYAASRGRQCGALLRVRIFDTPARCASRS